MSFFNFRRAGTSSAPNAGSNAPTESMEVIRKRAKHRLIGSAVLVLAGVAGFPILFDTQPRPIAVDIPIEIPGKNAVKPLVTLALPASAPVAAPTSAPAPPMLVGSAPDRVAAASSLSSKEEILTEKKAALQILPTPNAIKTEAKTDSKTESRPEAKTEVKPAPKPAITPDDGARARALLNGQAVATGTESTSTPDAAGTADDRLVVQVGAFADANKAREVRMKLEKAGLKTYTQVAETAGGKRIRVRVGPFASKADAEKAASKIKALDLPASILTL